LTCIILIHHGLTDLGFGVAARPMGRVSCIILIHLGLSDPGFGVAARPMVWRWAIQPTSPPSLRVTVITISLFCKTFACWGYSSVDPIITRSWFS